MRRLFFAASLGLFFVGSASLALTLYLWFGEWPEQVRETADHLRSVAANAGRPPEPLIGNIGARDATSLSGTWQAVIDPYARGDLGGIAPRALEPSTPSDLSEFSFENGLELRVPGDWNTQDSRLVFYQGVVWYKRTFHYSADQSSADGRRVFLHFGAANYRASVFLNGLLVGEHEGGFTPFNFEVGDALRDGENLLVVKVDSRMGADDVPTATTDWLNYGGLTRDVTLVSVPQVFVRNYALALASDGSDRIRGRVELDGARSGDTARVSIPELGIEIEVRVDAGGAGSFELAARPERWSPESPRLYEVEIRSADDVVRDRIGFRSVEAEGDRILLNGAPVFLRGISIHEEAPFGQGRAWSRAHAEALLGWARELGCNFVRLSHYPHNEAIVRLADEMGLLVWAEIPVYWNVDFENPVALERARRQLSELIARDRNRAAVILWSVGNETPHGDARLAFMSTLADHARTLDPTRLVTAALLSGPRSLAEFFGLYYLPAVFGISRDEWTYRVSDPLATALDVAALNEYFGWYYSGAIGLVTPLSSERARRIMLDHMDRIRIDPGVDKPLVISEFGAGARAGMHAPEDDLAVYTEEYQALVYRRQLAMLERQPSLAGMSPWILKDFRSPLRLYQGVQDYWNRKGLVSDDGVHKQAFDVLRAHYETLRTSRAGGA